MKHISIKLKLLINFFFLTSLIATAQPKPNRATTFNELSENFLVALSKGHSTSEIKDALNNTNLEALEKALISDNQKLAFWINIYNGFIIEILTEQPELYKDKRAFFKADQIPIAGRMLSFEKIEHGIIRKSQWPLGLGLIRKWFPNKLERKLRVDAREYRVHFALNCGAKDCPPVAVYSAAELDMQLAQSTTTYLQNFSTYNQETKEVAVTSLFNWFRGDFGNKKGVKKILKAEGIIPTTKGIDIVYKNYDWTLYIDKRYTPNTATIK